MQYRLSKILNLVLARSDQSLDEFEEVSPAVQVFLQLTRQIDRFAQLEQRQGASARPSASAASQAPPGEENAV
jgi:hypothetical protein